MADHTTYTTNTTSRSSGTLAFIVGALVVAVAVLAYVIFGADFGTSGASGPSIEINATSDSAAGAGPADTAPAAASGATAESGDAAATAGATAGN